MQSENIDQLISAMSKVQSQLRVAVKDSFNPHYKNKYADLGCVWEACREPLAHNGLAVIQSISQEDGKQMLVTTLAHISGQWMKSTMALPLIKPGAQELGSCITYCRRYSLAAMVGIYQGDDDDAEKADRSVREKSEKRPFSKEMIAAVAPFFAQDAEAVQIVKEKIGVDSWTQIPYEKFGDTMTWLKKRKEEREESNE